MSTKNESSSISSDGVENRPMKLARTWSFALKWVSFGTWVSGNTALGGQVIQRALACGGGLGCTRGQRVIHQLFDLLIGFLCGLLLLSRHGGLLSG